MYQYTYTHISFQTSLISYLNSLIIQQKYILPLNKTPSNFQKSTKKFYSNYKTKKISNPYQIKIKYIKNINISTQKHL